MSFGGQHKLLSSLATWLVVTVKLLPLLINLVVAVSICIVLPELLDTFVPSAKYYPYTLSPSSISAILFTVRLVEPAGISVVTLTHLF